MKYSTENQNPYDTRKLIGECIPFLKRVLEREKKILDHEETRLVKAIEMNKAEIQKCDKFSEMDRFRKLMEIDFLLSDELSDTQERRSDWYHANHFVLMYAFLSERDKVVSDPEDWKCAPFEVNLN